MDLRQRLTNIFKAAGSVIGLCEHPLKAELKRTREELENIRRGLDTAKPVNYVHPTLLTSDEEALTAIFLALKIDPTKIQLARAVDPTDTTAPEIVRAIARIVPVQDTGQNGEKLFTIANGGQAILCYDNPENYKSGTLYGTRNIGYLTTDGTYTSEFRNEIPALIVFNEGHTDQSPSYTVYTTLGKFGSYRKHGTFQNGQYRENMEDTVHCRPKDLMPKS